jgi:hypothetical protein
MASPVSLKSPPHVHHDVCRLDGCKRNAALFEILQELSSSDALMLDRRSGIAASLQVSTQIIQHLSLRQR